MPGSMEPTNANSLPFATPADVLATADVLDARQVWIYLEDPAGTEAWVGEPGGWTLRIGRNDTGRPVWVWASKPGKAIDIAFLHPQAVWNGPWGRPKPVELLAAIDAFAAALGVRWTMSGGVTSDRWLRDYYHGPGKLRIAPSQVVEVVADPLATQHNHWARPPGPTERDRKWAHAYDVNGQYLVAACNLALPVGPAEHLERPAPDKRRVGWWRLAGADTWIPTPTLELELQRVDRVDIEEAWIWGESHRWLEPWYRGIKHARGQLAPGSIESNALKALYSHGVGRLGSIKRASGANDPLYQPYWAAAIRAEANARLGRKLDRARANHGVSPFHVSADTTWWLADEADPLAYAAQIGLEVDDTLGHFKHAGTVEVTDELRLMLLAGTAHQVNTLLTKGSQP